MLVRKVVDKIYLSSLVWTIVSGTAPSLEAKTIGDILSKIEKKNERLRLNKSQQALPTAQKFKGASKRNLEEVKPPKRRSQYFAAGTDEAELEKITDAGINQLFKLTKKFRKSSQRGELWLRLAEQYVEKSRLIERRIQADYEKKLDAYFAKKIKNKPKLNLKPAHVYNDKAIQLYQWFLRDFPKDDKVDQALFFLGYNFMETGRTKKGEAYYKKLSSEHPKSPYVHESNFALGEYYFDRERWSEAEKYYYKVSRDKRVRLYSFALYKLGWCRFKLGRANEGLKALEGVVLAGRRSKGSQDRAEGGMSKIRLASEAIKDMIVFFAASRSPEEAKGYFGRVIGRKNLPKVLAKLGYYYAGTGSKLGAKIVFTELIAQDPNSETAFDYQYQIVSLYGAAGYSESFKRELFYWIQNYGPESVWQRVNKDKKQLTAKATQLIETTLRNFILTLHQSAQNSKVESARKKAREAYALYFETFKVGEKIDEMHFFYAELLFDMGEAQKAALHYLWVVEKSKNSKYRRVSLLNSILALEKSLPTSKEIKKITGKSVSPVEFDKNIKRFEFVALKYIKEVPQGENITAVKYRLATLYYYYNQFDKGLALFNDVVETDPKSKYTLYSANLILDTYNLRKDYKGLLAASEKLLQVPQIAKSPLGKEIKSIEAKTKFNDVGSAEGENPLQAAVGFADFAALNKGSELGFKALYNAAINFEKANYFAQAIPFYQKLLGTRTKKEPHLKEQAARFLGPLYEKIGEYEKAARAFEDYVRRYPKNKDVPDFYYNAAVIRDGMNHFKTAIRNYEKYMAGTRAADKGDTYFLIAKAYEKRGRRYFKSAIDNYQNFLNTKTSKRDLQVEAAFRIAELKKATRNPKDAEIWFFRTINIFDKFKRRGAQNAVSYAAEADFNLSYPTYEDLIKLKIPRSSKAQAAAVKKKFALIEKLKNKLTKVVRYNDGHQAVAALTLQGQAMQHMAYALFSAPKPKGLNKEEMKQYEAGVAQIAKPYEDQAIQSYEAAIAKGFELESYNNWLKKAQLELGKLKPGSVNDYKMHVFATNVPDLMEAK